MDGTIMHKCYGLPEYFDCDICPNNCDIESQDSVGPCGQQNCWYSCTVCRYNGLADGDECPEC